MLQRLKIIACLLCLAQIAVIPALADENGKTAGDFLIRLRGIAVIPDERSTVTPIGGSVNATATVMPEVDFTYFVTDNVAVELIAAVTKHSVAANSTTLGDVDLGSAWLLPPTLTLQYHFMPGKKLSPYAGAGVNYTQVISKSIPAAGPVTSISYGDSFGAALQVGADYDLGNRWFINIDLKKIWIKSNVSINGGAITAKAHLDPWVVGAGVGYRF